MMTKTRAELEKQIRDLHMTLATVIWHSNCWCETCRKIFTSLPHDFMFHNLPDSAPGETRSAELKRLQREIEGVQAEERRRCQLVVCSFEELSTWWKIPIVAAMDDPDWPTEAGKACLAQLEELGDEREA